MKIIKNQSVAQSMKLTVTEKDELRGFLENKLIKQDLIEYYLDHIKTKDSCKLKYLARDYKIKENRAEIALIIGHKLHWAKIKSVQFMKRDLPVRFDGVA